MYVMVRKYPGKGGLADRLAPPVRDGLVPILRQAPGFRSYCCFASEDGHLVSVSVFDDRPTAEAANAKVREWVTSSRLLKKAMDPQALALDQPPQTQAVAVSGSFSAAC